MKLTEGLRACSGCSQVKGIRYHARKKASVRASRRLEGVFLDLAKSKAVKTKERPSYDLLFRVGFSRFSSMYFLKSKDQASIAVQRFLADMRTEGTVEILGTDNGTEVLGDSSQNLDERKMKHEFTTLSTPELNSSAERTIVMDAVESVVRLHGKKT